MSSTFIDAAGILLIGYFAYTVIWTRSPPPHKVIGYQPNDFTRWRHQGNQPVVWLRGNAAPAEDHTVPPVLASLAG
jgi:hypothetical protein